MLKSRILSITNKVSDEMKSENERNKRKLQFTLLPMTMYDWMSLLGYFSIEKKGEKNVSEYTQNAIVAVKLILSKNNSYLHHVLKNI